MVKTVIFDIDGTLLDTERIYMQAWKLAAEEMGFPMPQIALLKTRAVNAAVAKACFQEYCGQDFPYEQVRDRRVAIGEQLIAQESPETLIKPNAHQVLQWLQSKGISLAAATSTNYKSTMAHLDHSGLTQYFSVIVTGDTNGDGKITVTDMIAIKSHLLGKSKFTGAAEKAADTNGDGKISITDFIQLKAHILGKSSVAPN